MGIFKGSNSQIGLDIGTTGVRLVQVAKGGAKPKLETYGSVAVDPKIAQSDSPADRQQLITAIKRLLTDSKTTGREVVVGLPSAKVYSSLVNLPKMSKPELEKSIPFQAEQYMPIALDQVKYDWIVTDEAGSSNQMEVLIVGVQNSVTENIMGIVEAIGLEPAAIEPDAFGLSRALVGANQGAAVVLNFGDNTTDLVTVYKSSPHLIRSIPIGGQTLVKTVAENLNLEHEQATQFLYKFGLSKGKLEGQVVKAIQTNVESLISEVDKSNKFFVSRYKDAKIEKIVITGGASQLPELPNTLANSTGLPVEIGNAWANIEYNPGIQDQLMQASNAFSVATGLALRGMI